MCLAISSKEVIFVNIFEKDFIPNIESTTKRTTGRAVPTPYTVGIKNDDSPFTAIGRRLPKKIAAEMGQNAKANKIPNINALPA